MIRESLRWGEPTINLDLQGNYVWCVPICLNARVAGGICSAAHPDRRDGKLEKKVGQAAWGLFNLACEQNICNESLMQINREESISDARRAEAIQSLKENLYLDPRAIYLREEFELLSAIRQRHKEKAREIINKILVGIYNLGKADFGVLKTLVLEMVVLMYRAAVDQGADPRELLGVNSSYLKDFHEIQDDINLSHWLTRWLEAFINTSIEYPHITTPVSISLALEYMKNNLTHPIARDEVARLCNMSPGYFSRIFREKTCYTFTELLNKFRIEHACSLLHETEMSAFEIAFDSGFNDQSYFNKVFRKYRGKTPKEYRKEGR
ncbi:HTH-type transcriptional activator RhaR [subsurface metagenome]